MESLKFFACHMKLLAIKIQVSISGHAKNMKREFLLVTSKF